MNKVYQKISINRVDRTKLIGPFIKVPTKIEGYNDIIHVLNQLELNEQGYKRLKKFNLTLNKVNHSQHLFFAYLLGFLVGDFSKKEIKRKFGVTRRFGLSLTQAHLENERVGEFASLCVNSIGLRMNRVKDTKPGRMNKYPFFRWNGQCSSLAQWIYNVCLGLRDNQVTTYDEIKADWILTAPSDFKIWFIQGLADSDGFIDTGTLETGIIVTPNKKLIERIFKTLDIHIYTKKYHHNTLEAVMASLNESRKIQLFNEYAQSHRYELSEKLKNSKRLSHHLPRLIGEEVNNHIKEGLSTYKISRMILDKYNIAMRRTSIMKRRNTLLR